MVGGTALIALTGLLDSKLHAPNTSANCVCAPPGLLDLSFGAGVPDLTLLLCCHVMLEVCRGLMRTSDQKEFMKKPGPPKA